MKLKSLHLLPLGILSLLCFGGSWIAASKVEIARANFIAQGGSEPSTPSPKPSETASPESSPAKPIPTSSLDYSQLQQALNQKNHENADQITYKLMSQLAGSKSNDQGRFDLVEWNSFKCDDLKKIDKFWQDATGGNQGFSAQYRILQGIAGNSSVERARNYYIKIGWKNEQGEWLVYPKYNEASKTVGYVKKPNFKDPPPGHLPAKLAWADRRDHRFKKIAECGL